MTTATTQFSWHRLAIPPCLEPVGRPWPKQLMLRLASESDRREWECQFEVNRTPARMSGFVYLEPRRAADQRRPDLSGIWTVFRNLQSSRARYCRTDLSFSFEGVTHDEGLQLVQAMLAAVARQMEARQ